MQPTLVVLAAGMGSRYGGLKQMEPVGPSGETMLEYSLYDAIRAGFGRVVFVIRRDFEKAFREKIGDCVEGQIDVDYAFQELKDLPEGFQPPEGRTKPWGTAHAVRAVRKQVDGPFAVINADDFYGRDAYARLATHFATLEHPGNLHVCLVGYRLDQTLSPHGSVNRGICEVDSGSLRDVREFTGIVRESDGVVRGLDPDGQSQEVPEDAPVSMNFWGFTPALFTEIEKAFTQFMRERGTEPKSECYLPAVIDALIKADEVTCPVLSTDAAWFGVTYPEDRPAVAKAVAAMTESGEYPSPLFPQLS